MKINAELILELRMERGWSQEELAITSGLNLRTIQRMETKASASLQSKKALASAFDIDIQSLDYEQSKTVKKYEYKTVEMPFKFGILKQGTPNIDNVLNEQGNLGWRLHQIVMPASSNMGQSEKMIAVFEREVSD